jgi:hypothetical protein
LRRNLIKENGNNNEQIQETNISFITRLLVWSSFFGVIVASVSKHEAVDEGEDLSTIVVIAGCVFDILVAGGNNRIPVGDGRGSIGV